jgi:hypothetical protein
MKPGDLVQTKLGKYGTVVRGPYTYRFMEAEDYEMADHGMGGYAGLYGSAIDVVFSTTGVVRRFKMGDVKVLKND